MQNHQELRAPYILISTPANCQLFSNINLTVSQEPDEKQARAIKAQLEQVPAITTVMLSGPTIHIHKKDSVCWEALKLGVLFVLENVLFADQEPNVYNAQLTESAEHAPFYKSNLNIA